jgi:CRISPR-associated protein (TIGR02710 family)
MQPTESPEEVVGLRDFHIKLAEALHNGEAVLDMLPKRGADMTEENAILVCTVGGSHQPILTALKARSWNRVVFVCTPETEDGRGSATMVEKAVEIPASIARPAEKFEAIPIQAGLVDGHWETLEVPADDPDRAFQTIVERLRALARDGGHIVADYTGGTKSMSAALFLAALDAGAELQLVTGRRSDLVRVLDLTEREIAIGTRRVSVAREFERLAAGWSRFAYQEVAESFDRLWNELKAEGLPREELRPFTRAKELSAAFAAWDRFDHNAAAGGLRKGTYKSLEIDGRSDWYDLAAGLARGQNEPWGALQLRDLWHNAQRCAARGRHDDAVARLYRLWEAMAQWLLRVDCRIDTAVVEIGLEKSWDLYRHLRPDGAAAAFWQQTGDAGRSERDRLREKLRIRNHSIWAHGWDPVFEKGWKTLSDWTETGLLLVLACEAERLGERHELPQLPTQLPPL